VWEAASGREVSDIRLASPVWQAAWSPNGKQVATASAAGTAQVWDVASGKEAFALQGRTPEQFDVAWSPDGKSLATTAGPDFSVRIWDASPTAQSLFGTGGVIFWVSWSPDSRRIAVTEIYSRTVVIFDALTGVALLSIATGHTSDLEDAHWAPDGSRIVTTACDNLAKVWDANTGQELLTFRGHVGEPPGKFVGGELLVGAGWSPDGSRIATTGGSGRERIWDARTGQEYVSFQATSDIAPLTRWSPDGKRLASVSLPEVLQIWDAATGAPILGGYVHNTAQLSYGDPITGFWGLDWSPEGDRILTTSIGGEAAIWDARTGQRTLVFREHSAPIPLPMWAPNGKRIATGDVSGVIKVWDAQTGAVLLDFSVPVGDMLFNVAWSPDGTRLAAATLLPSVEIHRVWQSKEDLVAYARECCVVRQLTPAERKQFGLP
jgi:WD40 repeat protein